MNDLTYPQSMRYVLNRLTGFSRNRVRTLLPYTSASPSQSIIMRLPTNAMVDLTTLTLGLDITTYGGASYAVPPHVGMLIDFIDVSIGGSSIQTISHHAQLFKALWNYQSGDQAYKQSLYECGGMTSQTPGACTFSNVSLFFTQFLGFLGCGKILNTALLPEITLTVRFVPNIACASGINTASYILTNLALSFDVCTLDNPVYYEVLQRQLQSDGGIKLPFTNYLGVQGQTSTLPCQANFSVSTQSLDYLIGTLQPSTYLNSATLNTATGLSNFFNHGMVPGSAGTDNITSAQYQVGSALVPSYRPTLPEQLVYTLQSMGNLNLDTTGQSYQGFRANTTALPASTRTNEQQYQSFEEGNFLFVARLCSGDKQYMSGLSTAGTNAVMTFRVEGTSTNQYIPLVFMQFTSVLSIGPNRQISLIL